MQVDKKLIKNAYIFDIYAGKNIEEGKKSVSVNVSIQALDRTLLEIEIDQLSNNIIEAVTKNTKGTLRG